MGFLDRAKEAAQRAKSQARVAREQGQQRLEDLQARRQAEILLRDVGIAAYEEHRGESDHEAVVRALARLDAHVRNHPLDLSTGGLRGYMRTATGGTTESAPATEAKPEPGDGEAKADDTADAKTGTEKPGADEARTDEPKAEDPDEPKAGNPAEPAAKKAAKKTTKKAAKKTTKKATAKKTTKKTAKKAPSAEAPPEPAPEPDRPE